MYTGTRLSTALKLIIFDWKNRQIIWKVNSVRYAYYLGRLVLINKHKKRRMYCMVYRIIISYWTPVTKTLYVCGAMCCSQKEFNMLVFIILSLFSWSGTFFICLFIYFFVPSDFIVILYTHVHEYPMQTPINTIFIFFFFF